MRKNCGAGPGGAGFQPAGFGPCKDDPPQAENRATKTPETIGGNEFAAATAAERGQWTVVPLPFLTHVSGGPDSAKGFEVWVPHPSALEGWGF